MKLWEKGYQLDPLVETFMTGDDPILDRALIKYDCLGSIAHAKMLAEIGILTTEECQLLVQNLVQIMFSESFTIDREDEDVHTAVENALVAQLGDLGKKLHTARSRNDQALVDLRLYARDFLIEIMHEVLQASKAFCLFAEKHSSVPIPGRTHFQRAMPSSLGLWGAAFAESFLDDFELLKTAYHLNDQCPLGSGASYGVSLPIDRQLTSDLLGFRKVQNNVLYTNNSRGKFESIILSALVQVMNDLSKMCTDLIIFSVPEFGYINLPEKFCTGSSMMPQKRNPDLLELIRAKSASLQGMYFQVSEIIRSLPSGYNRDFQETKRPLMRGFEETSMSLKAFTQLFSELEVNIEVCIKAFSTELYATDQALHFAQQGIPFRAAYKKVAMKLDEVIMEDPVANILSKTHLGATGNLGVDAIFYKIQKDQKWVDSLKEKIDEAFRDLF